MTERQFRILDKDNHGVKSDQRRCKGQGNNCAARGLYILELDISGDTGGAMVILGQRK